MIEKTRGLARRTQDLSIDMNRRANGEYDATTGGEEKGKGGKGGGNRREARTAVEAS